MEGFGTLEMHLLLWWHFFLPAVAGRHESCDKDGCAWSSPEGNSSRNSGLWKAQGACLGISFSFCLFVCWTSDKLREMYKWYFLYLLGVGGGGLTDFFFYWCLYGCRSLKTNLKIFVLCWCPYDCRPTLKTTLKVFVFYLGLYDCRLFWRQTSRSLLHTCLVFIYDCRLTLKTTLKIFVSHLCLCDFTPTLKTALKIFVSYLCLCDSTPTSKTALGIVVLHLCLCDCTPTLKTFLKMFISYFVHQPSRSLFHTCLCDSTPTLKTAHKIFASYLCVGATVFYTTRWTR